MRAINSEYINDKLDLYQVLNIRKNLCHRFVFASTCNYVMLVNTDGSFTLTDCLVQCA